MLTQIEAQHALDRIILRVTGGSMQNVVSLSELWLQTPPLMEKNTVSKLPRLFTKYGISFKILVPRFSTISVAVTCKN